MARSLSLSVDRNVFAAATTFAVGAPAAAGAEARCMELTTTGIASASKINPVLILDVRFSVLDRDFFKMLPL